MMTSKSLLLCHDIYALRGPGLETEALALLQAGAEIRPISQRDGFIQIELSANQYGYIPSAVCSSAAIRSLPAPVQLVMPSALHSSPTRSIDPRILIQPAEQFQVVAITGKFAAIRRTDGQGGYVPQLLLTKERASPGYYRLKQAVMIYSMPMPGGQQVSPMIVAPEEQLQLLGMDRQAALVQRADGQLGFVAAALIEGVQLPEALFQIGPIDLGWIALGGGWGLINWLGLGQAIIYGRLVPAGIQWLLMLALVIAIFVGILRYGRQPIHARSFGIGALLAYVLLFLSAKGW